MSLNSYQVMLHCLRIVPKINRLSALTGISKSTLTLIAKERGNYEGCLSTRMRLESFLIENTNKIGRPKKG